jgi:hypothetical protein
MKKATTQTISKPPGDLLSVRFHQTCVTCGFSKTATAEKRKKPNQFKAFVSKLQNISGGREKLRNKLRRLVAVNAPADIESEEESEEVEESGEEGEQPREDEKEEEEEETREDEEDSEDREPREESEGGEDDTVTADVIDDEVEVEPDEEEEVEDDPVHVANRNFNPPGHMLGVVDCVSGVENGKVVVRGSTFVTKKTSLPGFVVGLNNAGKALWLTEPPALPENHLRPMTKMPVLPFLRTSRTSGRKRTRVL